MFCSYVLASVKWDRLVTSVLTRCFEFLERKLFIYFRLKQKSWIIHLNLLHVLFLSLACSPSYLQNTYEYRRNVCDVIYLCCPFQLFICLFIHGRTNWNWKIHFCWRALGLPLSPPYTKRKEGVVRGLLVIARFGVPFDSTHFYARKEDSKRDELKLKVGKSNRRNNHMRHLADLKWVKRTGDEIWFYQYSGRTPQVGLETHTLKVK